MVDPEKARHLLALYRGYRTYLEDLAARSDEALRSDFAVMGGVRQPDLATRLMAMARFRNVLVDLYAQVDEERVLRILREEMGDLDDFVAKLRDRFRKELETNG